MPTKRDRKCLLVMRIVLFWALLLLWEYIHQHSGKVYLTKTGCIGNASPIGTWSLKIIDMEDHTELNHRDRPLDEETKLMCELESRRRTEERLSPSGLVRVGVEPQRNANGDYVFWVDCPRRREAQNDEYVLHCHLQDVTMYGAAFDGHVESQLETAKLAVKSGRVQPPSPKPRPPELPMKGAHSPSPERTPGASSSGLTRPPVKEESSATASSSSCPPATFVAKPVQSERHTSKGTSSDAVAKSRSNYVSDTAAAIATATAAAVDSKTTVIDTGSNVSQVVEPHHPQPTALGGGKQKGCR